MTPFTPTWTIYLVLLIGVTIGAWAVLRRGSERRWRAILCGIAVVNVGISTTFTFNRIADPAYPDFVLSRNWPLHFCTLVTFLLVPGMLATKQWWARPLHTLLFFPGSLAALLALAAPGAEYIGHPLWSMNSWFYVIHGLNFVLPLLHAGLGGYRPRWRDPLLSLVWFTILAMVVLGITVFARAVVDPKANYMYFFDPEGSGILVVLWHLIHIPVLYELPLLPILYPVLLAMCAVQRGFERLGRALRRTPPAADPTRGSSALGT
ncbi:MAG: YwaF family protein [Micrococcales bacterium]|nr:YwaF family protein [Micrococcales bacterium]